MPISEPAARQTLPSLRHLSKWLVLAAVLAAVMYGVVQWQAKQQAEQKIRELTAEPVVEATSAPGTSNTDVKEEVEDLATKVSEIVLLPTGETPSISTITNLQELTENKDFFIDAQEGDKILLYPNAKRVYLYRPSAHKLINMAPIIEKSTIATPTSTPETAVSPTTEAEESNEEPVPSNE